MDKGFIHFEHPICPIMDRWGLKIIPGAVRSGAEDTINCSRVKTKRQTTRQNLQGLHPGVSCMNLDNTQEKFHFPRSRSDVGTKSEMDMRVRFSSGFSSGETLRRCSEAPNIRNHFLKYLYPTTRETLGSVQRHVILRIKI